MTIHTFKLKQTFHLPAEVEFSVEFNTETGEAEVIGDGVVVSSTDHLRRRQIMKRSDFDDLDAEAYAKLLDDGVVERPKDGDTIHLGGDVNVVSIDPDDADDVARVDGRTFIELYLTPKDDLGPHRKRKIARLRLRR